MDSKLEEILKFNGFHFDSMDVNKFIVKDDKVSLEEQMLQNTADAAWKKCARKLGQFEARFCHATRLDQLSDTDHDKFNISEILGKNRLKNWLEENLSNPVDSILSVLPRHINKTCKEQEEETGRARSVGSNLQELHSSPGATQSQHSLNYKARKAIQLMADEKYCFVLQNLRADTIIWAEEDIRITKLSDFGVTVGPLSLQLSLNMADFFVMYYQMRRKFYIADVTLAQICNEIGKTFKETFEKLLLTTLDNEKFWKEVSLLTGWEILRRCHTQDNVSFDVQESSCCSGGNDGCVNAALRLIGASGNIDSVGRLTFIGFALC